MAFFKKKKIKNILRKRQRTGGAAILRTNIFLKNMKNGLTLKTTSSEEESYRMSSTSVSSPEVSDLKIKRKPLKYFGQLEKGHGCADKSHNALHMRIPHRKKKYKINVRTVEQHVGCSNPRSDFNWLEIIIKIMILLIEKKIRNVYVSVCGNCFKC